MSDFPGLAGHPITIHSLGPEAVERSGFGFLTHIISATTGAYPTASAAIYVPFFTPVPITAVKMGCYNGTTAAGNVDLGIYNAVGTRLVSTGSTAQAGTSVIQEFDITDTTLPAGSYYLALAADDGTATFFAVAPGSNKMQQLLGIKTEAAALPLPAAATFAACTFNYIPVFFLTTRTVV